MKNPMFKPRLWPGTYVMTQSDYDEIVADYKRTSLHEVAEKWGMTTQSVRAILVQQGTAIRTRGRNIKKDG